MVRQQSLATELYDILSLFTRVSSETASPSYSSLEQPSQASALRASRRVGLHSSGFAVCSIVVAVYASEYLDVYPKDTVDPGQSQTVYYAGQ